MPSMAGAAEFGEEEAPHIFAEVVSVHIKPSGRDDYTAQLTVRLRPDNISHPRSLLLELTDENDLLFYHSLALGEGDFHSLRSEQRLLVDFQSFPEQLAGLLRRCCSDEGLASGARMLAQLDCSSSGDSLFSIIESNHFRELIHIALRLRQGSDEVVKQHLAHKLRASRSEASSLSERLASSSEAFTQCRKQNDELVARARVVAEERAHLEQSLQATHQRELSELRQEHSRAIADVQRAHIEERSKIDLEHRQALDSALGRAKTAESSAEELRQQRQSLTASGESCRERLEMAESRLQEATKETGELRDQVQQLEGLKFRQERELAELRVQLASSKEQLVVREQQAASQATQIEEAVGQRRMLEETLAGCRKQAQSLEEKFALSAQEIAKGNRIIQSLHSASKEAKAKLKLKASALVQQEKSMLELGKADEFSKHVIGEKDVELSRGKAREERLQQDIEELKKKLAEAHDVIKSNQEVIEYLNRQLTERDLKAIPGGSSFSLPHTDTAPSSFRGTGTTSSALAELLGRAESLGQSPKKTLGLTSSASAGTLGWGSSGLSPYSLGSTSAMPSATLSSAGTSAALTALAAPAAWSPGRAAAAQLAGSPATDAMLRGPVAYRRPGAQALDALPPSTAVA